MYLFYIDLPTINENNPSEYNQTIVIILIGSIALITCIICCIHQYCRHRRQRQDFIPIDTQRDLYPQLPEASAPRYSYDLRDRWENIQDASVSNNNSLRNATIRPRKTFVEDFYSSTQSRETNFNTNTSRTIISVHNFGAIIQSNDICPIDDDDDDDPPAYSGLRIILS